MFEVAPLLRCSSGTGSYPLLFKVLVLKFNFVFLNRWTYPTATPWISDTMSCARSPQITCIRLLFAKNHRTMTALSTLWLHLQSETTCATYTAKRTIVRTLCPTTWGTTSHTFMYQRIRNSYTTSLETVHEVYYAITNSHFGHKLPMRSRERKFLGKLYIPIYLRIVYHGERFYSY